MDPITHGALGAALSQSSSARKHSAVAVLFGMLAGMAPDLDVLIRSDSDPLLYLEYHRQFTHSLIFIPVGGFICGLLLYWIVGRRWLISLKQSALFCTLGYAIHGVLDACTSYGTQLLWPFSDERFARSVMPIIDPAYTLPVILLIVIAAIKRNPAFARLALVWVLVYPLVGLLQRERAEAGGWEIAAQRGHQPVRLEVKPSLGSLLVWKVIYEADNRYYVDAVRVGWEQQLYAGDSIEKLNVERDYPWLDPASQQALDIARFRWFSGGFVARDVKDPLYVIDARYSLVPNQISPLWGIVLSPEAGPDDHVDFRTSRHQSVEQRQIFFNILAGNKLD